MTDYVARTLRAYDANPEQYESATALMTPWPEVDTLLSSVPNKDLPVVDAGCAFGRDTAVFAERGFNAVGIDMSDGLLDRARELYPDLPFRKMDIRALDFADESLGGIWCHATLLHLNDKDIRTALGEFRRTLALAGVAFLSFKEGTGDEELVEKFSSSSSRYFNYQTTDTVRGLVEAAGLRISKLYTINERERWGADKRDLNWVYCFATK